MHMLEIDRSGRASFVYNQKNGNPWHQLGDPFPSAITLDAALESARVRIASGAPLYAMTPSGMIEVEDSQAIVWPSIDDPGQFDVLGTVGSQYKIVQYRDVAEIAFAVVGAAPEDAVLDTMGILNDGRRFFGFIDFGDVEIALPNGMIDRAYKGLGFLSSHDGSQAITFYTSMIRAVCNNTVQAGLRTAKNIVAIRHKRNADDHINDVPRLLNLAYNGDQEFMKIAAELNMIENVRLADVVKAIWPKPVGQDATERELTIWNNRFEKIVRLYDAPSNAGGFGENGWSIYNTITEYLDHSLGKDAARRARGAIDPTSLSSNRKRQAVDAIFAMA